LWRHVRQVPKQTSRRLWARPRPIVVFLFLFCWSYFNGEGHELDYRHDTYLLAKSDLFVNTFG
jgi:hypothetical protein